MSLTTPKTIHLSLDIPGYQIVEQLYLGSRTAVYRGIQIAQQRPVVIKVLRKEYPSFKELVQFRNQYTISKNFSIAGIIQPLGLEPLGSSYMLVMEDWGGISLSEYLEQQKILPWSEAFEIAVQLTDILHELARHQVIHKDIKPANILINPKSKLIKLIDFSIATLLPKEIQESQSTSTLEGTLAYLAPEQTGRMNRGIDYRSDFYALGVTLYQLLTGTLPFNSPDPLELVHYHIAKIATPIHLVNSDIPEQVSAIAAKLMAKNAEDRYQSAMGLKHDLKCCLTQWKETGEIKTFELGQRDLSDSFLIPEKLYGRENEVKTLLDAFNRVAEGASELMLVAGFSGIGKTAVVNEVHKPITRQKGYLIRGKYDQFNRNIPLSAFLEALRDLMQQLLTESDTQLEDWKNKILAAVEVNGQVLIEVIPELEQIIGKQPEVPELSGSAAQNRFNLLFPKFIKVFSVGEHPLVIFLDDLQWADAASLQLINLLMKDNGYLLMLGAYRDNEVSPVHPFMLTVDELTKTGKTVNKITLSYLEFTDLNRLIADILSCSVELAKPLTQLVIDKTQGNPFFLTQFLKALHEDKLIAFNYEQRYWEYEIADVKARSLTDDVVELMAQQLQKLPTETQYVLKLAACIGNHFDLDTLAIVSEKSPTQTAAVLWKALQEGLVLPTSQVYKLFQSATESEETNNTANPVYRFLHDRVQQAAYFLIPGEQKQITHLKIGQLLLQNIPAPEQQKNLFKVVSQLNMGIPLLENPKERENLVQMNLAAAQKARASIAYAAACNYLQTALSQLVAILYLENRVTVGAFTCDRIELLNILSTQAAISLENARLYQQQQQKTDELAQKEAEYRSIFESVNDGLSICNLETKKLVASNPTIFHIYGYSPEEWLQLNPLELLHPESLHVFDNYLEVLKSGHEFYTQGIGKRKDGSFFDFEAKAVPFTYKGEPHGLTIIRDISDRKAAEAVIIQKSQALEQALQDLQNAQLQTVQSEKMASLGNLVAGVAHEINNPIGFLNGSINNAKEYVKEILAHLELYRQHYPTPVEPIEENSEDIDLEFLSEDLPKMLNAMKEACNRIKNISTSLRTFSRADNEHKVSANLHEGIDSTILILKYRLKANEFRPAIEIIQEYGQLPTIECFPGQLNQVFMNILANAIDMFDEIAQTQSFEQLKTHPQKIIIFTQKSEKEVLISIRDNGKGIDKKTQARIFDHLFTTKSVGKGTGLGLAIAKQIIEEKHAGRIEVRSIFGQGTEFAIYLPLI